MAFSYRLRAQAQEDLRDICDHIAEDDPQAALNLYNRFLAKFELLADHPKMSGAIPYLAPERSRIGFDLRQS